jgi:hypothetical protein
VKNPTAVFVAGFRCSITDCTVRKYVHVITRQNIRALSSLANYLPNHELPFQLNGKVVVKASFIDCSVFHSTDWTGS